MSKAHKAESPRVSIGMPTYNGERYIRKAIESIIHQSFSDWELIISDNCSTDITGEICREFSERDSRIHYVRQCANIGAKENFKFVLAEASGDYFAWAADDDYRSEGFLKELVEVLDDHVDVVCAMTDVTNVYEEHESSTQSGIENLRLGDVKKNWRRVRRLFFQNPTSNIYFCVYGLFRKEVLVHGRLSNDALKYSAGTEIPFLAQIACRGKLVSVALDGFFYRRHAESTYYTEQRKVSQLALIFHSLRISFVLVGIVRASGFPLKIKCELVYEIFHSSRITVNLLSLISRGSFVTHISTVVRRKFPRVHRFAKKIVGS